MGGYIHNVKMLVTIVISREACGKTIIVVGDVGTQDTSAIFPDILDIR